MLGKSFRTTLAAISLAALGVAPCRPTLGQAPPSAAAADAAALKTEIEQIKGMLPSQSHTMIDVEYHFANLWFAARAENWPLATFYLNETRGHLNWALRVRPVRKLADGSELDLRPILKGVEEGALATLKTAVDKHDSAAFEPAYRAMLAQCQACHAAAEKPFLRPQIPTAPPSPLIDMRPAN
jgi:hypothetical protein